MFDLWIVVAAVAKMAVAAVLIPAGVSKLLDRHGFDHLYVGDEELVRRVKADFQHAAISDKLKALLVIAGKVQKGGKHVTLEDVDAARNLGATDLEIHDTVLIAAAFCMYNRYVDGLATVQPLDEASYRERGRRVARDGYINVSKGYLAIYAVAR